MNMNISKEARYIIETLNLNGYEAYIVGGCVRDYLLGIEPKDWDITTSAKPNSVKEIFEHTYDTGIKHGTITIVLNHKNFEVTTYRIEGKYSDYRHPEEVRFTQNIEEDLSRRDFTMNAIAYHDINGFVDPFNGIQDIKAKIIKGVGNSDERFKEDALRMLRAVRFSAQLDFYIEENTFKALIKNSMLIQNISIERIRDEFIKLITSQNPEKLFILKDTGLLQYFFSEMESALKEKGNYITACLKILKDNVVLCFSILLEHLTIDDAKEIMKRFKFDNKTINKTINILKYSKHNIDIDSYKIKKIISVIGNEEFEHLVYLKRTQALVLQNKEDLFKYECIEKLYDKIVKNNDCVFLAQLDINGNDLKNMGISTGKNIGVLLNSLFDIVLKEPQKNKKEILIDIAHDIRIN